MGSIKITLSPTGRFETVDQGGGRVRCRIWEGVSESGSKIIAHIPLIGLHNDAPLHEHDAFGKALSEVKAERLLVSFDMRMVL
jgi:hypothetical protein